MKYQSSAFALTMAAALALTMSSCSKEDDPVEVGFAPATDLANVTGNYVARDGEILTGSAGNVKISIAAGATVTLDGVTIYGVAYSEDWAGITCEGDATIILADGSENKVISFDLNHPGILPGPVGSTLTISGTGKLEVSSELGAGIGNILGDDYQCGAITITGGIVTATGGNGAAGIGSGKFGSCGNITISGGTVVATAGSFSAGIGCGHCGTCGDITITKGEDVVSVTATKSLDAHRPIGLSSGGDDCSCGKITFGNTVKYDPADESLNAKDYLGYGVDGLYFKEFDEATWMLMGD